ncbi:SIS domain-containing protein [Lachnospiraceae bacterium WCA-9-b2]|jgi:arabinose-5-phosphate isomerase|uniref:SIS domain-containing protein n=1 Tax=Sporofaciens musculi TaxID=2681861 RepID=A0A7X3MJZ1_9FIRM|nr:SIS domain-containing protein [Sporofaciens musculi]MXP77824.1 SIS domain-containing protein [Sporofaciens musculi]
MIAYFENELKEIEASIHSLNEDVFARWVEEGMQTINTGHKIIVSGLGKNVPICEKFVGSMVSVGMDAAFLHTNSAVHGDMGIVKEGDMVIILTKSGETSESIYLARLLKERKVNMWLLTFEAESTLTREISNCIILKLNNEGDMWNIMPNNSTTINLIILQGLCMQIAKKRGIQIRDFRKNHPGGHIGEILSNH